MIGAHARHGHFVDVVTVHALQTGQWSKRVTFHDLTGRPGPSPLDSRGVPDAVPLDEDEQERQARAAELLAAHEARMGLER